MVEKVLGIQVQQPDTLGHSEESQICKLYLLSHMLMGTCVCSFNFTGNLISIWTQTFLLQGSPAQGEWKGKANRQIFFFL